MPIYEYRCETCQKIHEVIQKFSDPPLKSCPVCGGPAQKMVSLSSFQLKGTGWYKTDYKKSGEGSGTEKKAETKPDAAPAPTPAPAATSAGTKKGGDS